MLYTFLEAPEDPGPSIISDRERNFKFGRNTKLLKILILEVARIEMAMKYVSKGVWVTDRRHWSMK